MDVLKLTKEWKGQYEKFKTRNESAGQFFPNGFGLLLSDVIKIETREYEYGPTRAKSPVVIYWLRGGDRYRVQLRLHWEILKLLESNGFKDCLIKISRKRHKFGKSTQFRSRIENVVQNEEVE